MTIEGAHHHRHRSAIRVEVELPVETASLLTQLAGLLRQRPSETALDIITDWLAEHGEHHLQVAREAAAERHRQELLAFDRQSSSKRPGRPRSK